LHYCIDIKTSRQELGEDEASIEMHKEKMKKEMKKSNADADVINDRMARSLVDRETLIKTFRVSVVLMAYPALQKEQLVGLYG